jgi:hypothetical protein
VNGALDDHLAARCLAGLLLGNHLPGSELAGMEYPVL